MTDTIDWSVDNVLKDRVLAVSAFKPNYNMTFHKGLNEIGVLDFNGPEMIFKGDMEESAKLFFNWIAESFKQRLEQERTDERETCAVIAETAADYLQNSTFEGVANAIRARGESSIRGNT